MQILNEYTKVMYSDGWVFVGIVFVLLLVFTIIFTINCLFDGDHVFAAVMLGFVFLCGIGVFASFTMANKGEHRYIQCIIEEDYPASELMKYEIESVDGKIITLKEREIE